MSTQWPSNTRLESKGSQTIHLKLSNELFLFLGIDGGKSGAGYFPLNGIVEEVEKFVAGFLKEEGVREEHVTLKCVGSNQLLHLVKRSFNSRGFKASKWIEREGDFEILYDPSKASIQASKPQASVASGAKRSGKIKVLIIDDSKPIRNLLEKVLGSDPNIEVVGMAEKPSDADKILDSGITPDVITLDIHMPEMNGVEYLRRILGRGPMRVMMISSISMEESSLVLDALQLGAVDYIQKPSMQKLSITAPIIVERIKQAAHAKVLVQKPKKKEVQHNRQAVPSSSKHIVLIGSSTGGTTVIQDMLTILPKDIPPVLITQHIPPVFSKAFAERLNSHCPFTVKEAEHGEPVLPGRVYIAPGGTQMALVRVGSDFQIRINDDPPMGGFKPSVDYLFNSAADILPPNSVAAILTGMGKDGAQGLLKLRQNGVRTLAQSEDTCVVFGMPKEAIARGAVDDILHPALIADCIVRPGRDKTKKKKVA